MGSLILKFTLIQYNTIGNFRKVHYDYYQTISRCFEESFTKQIGEFNVKNNSIFTGHLMGEETFSTVMIYSPWETEISSALQEGENSVEIILINSLRNLLGPHHHPGGELTGVGPVSFTGNPGWPNNGGDRDWFDFRLKGNPTLWRDDYYLIPFGLLKPPVISETD